MKKATMTLLLCFLAFTMAAQGPDYRQRLYYTCKAWGFVKYYHSRVSVCQVNWDSVLLQTLPAVKNSSSFDSFNDALATMLAAAGPMEPATTPSPDTLPAELKRNLDFGWINDPVFRTDVKAVLDFIRVNFRPHPVCWVKVNDFTGTSYGYLLFPFDDPMIGESLNVNYPDEISRLLILFKYWNILNYFNPYNYILDQSPDSTLSQSVLPMAGISNYPDFYKEIKKISAHFDDAHVEGLTYSTAYTFPGYFMPKLLLNYIEGQYVVVKSGFTAIRNGDIIVSVDSMTVSQWEDSLRPYISAGNPAVFQRTMCDKLLRGGNMTPIRIDYRDSLGNVLTQWTFRNSYYGPWFYDYYPNDTLKNAKWKYWSGNVGYINMGNLDGPAIDSAYGDLKETVAIIFDMRNYPISNAARILADMMYPEPTVFSKLAHPDVEYPGTFSWEWDSLAYNGNPNPYPGTVILLVNQETQSAAEYNCMIFSAMPKTIVVGSQTAGADGNITNFNIGQEMKAGYTSLGVYYPDGEGTQRIGIVPDSVVSPTRAGIMQGRDEVLEKALQVAQPSLAVEPPDLSVSAPAGTASFLVRCNREWTAECDSSWCTVSASGSGNGNLVAIFTENPAHEPRTAAIRVMSEYLPIVTVTLTQGKSTIGLEESPGPALHIYPNPASTVVCIHGGLGITGLKTVTISNVLGSVVLSQSGPGEMIMMDVSALENGTYLVTVSGPVLNPGKAILVISR